MAEKISNLDKEAMQLRLVEEFEKRIDCIEKWEDKNPITVLLLRNNLFLSIKNIEQLVEESEQLKQIKEESKDPSKKKISVDPEAEEEKMRRLEYKSNVLRLLKFYEVPTVRKEVKIKNPRYNPESTFPEDKEEFVSMLIQESRKHGVTDLENLGTQSFLYRLLGLTGRSDIKLEDLVYNAKTFENKGYEINLDNFLKIALILQRTKLRIPVVCIGETGCGKTFMIKFISSVLMNVKEFCHETLHTGYTELELKNFITEKVERARKAMEVRKVAKARVDELRLKKYSAKGNRKAFNEKDKKDLKEAKIEANKSDEIWIFFDEFNTSVLQNYICEIMAERVSSLLPFDTKYGQKIPDNIVFLAAANPYRLRERNNNEGIIHPSAKTLLSHMVNPIPENILDYVWDYGVLEQSVEKTYIQGMVDSKRVFVDQEMKKIFVECISIGQRTMRTVEEGDNSSVSLRDLQRTMKICKFFQKFLKDRVAPSEDILTQLGDFSYWKYPKNPLEDKLERQARSIILTLAICYLFRLCNKENKETLIEKFISVMNANFKSSNRVFTKEWAQQVICDEQDDYLYRIKGVNKLPNDIAMNRSLKENVLTILVCILNKIPLFICGKPGSSKTQSFQILKNVMKGVSIDETLFSELPEINESYYQGTLHSTSQGIENLFRKAKQNARDNENSNILTVFFFDEIGLAEISKNNPLKVLHNLLEEKDMLVAFVGISNWTLDASKMNRAVYLARWDLDKVDLLEICEQFGTLNQNLLKTNPNMIRTNFELEENQLQGDDLYANFKDIISETYLEFRAYQTRDYLHKNFHGTRDFYSLIKFLFRNIKFPNTARNTRKEHSSGQKFKKQRDNVKRLLYVLKQAFERNFSGGFDVKNHSSEVVIKEMFLNNLSKKTGQDIEDFGVDRSDFLMTEAKLDIVRDSLKDMKGRFLLVFVDSDFVEQKVEKIVRETSSKGKVHFLCGSQFDADLENNKYSTEILKDIKLYIEEGFTIIMKDLDVIYGALYDLFNQNYLTVNEKNFCRITFENHKESVAIHDDFRLIILQKSQNEFKDIETSQPAPFLNRFEKLNIYFKDIVSEKMQKVMETTKTKLKENVQSIELALEPNMDALIYDFSEMMLVNQIMGIVSQEKRQKEVDVQTLSRECLDSFLPFYSFQMFLIEWARVQSSYSEVQALEKKYLETHQFNSLPEFLQKSVLESNDPLYKEVFYQVKELEKQQNELTEGNLAEGQNKQVHKKEKECLFRKSVVFTKTNFMDFQAKIQAECLRMEEINKEGKSWFENRLVTFLNENSENQNFVVFVENFQFWNNISMVRHLINQVEKKMGLFSVNALSENELTLRAKRDDSVKILYKHFVFVIHYNEKLSSNKVTNRGKALCLWQQSSGWRSFAIDSLSDCRTIQKIEDFKKDLSKVKMKKKSLQKELVRTLETSCQIFNYDMDLRDSLKYVSDLRSFYGKNPIGQEIFEKLYLKSEEVIGREKGDWRKSVIESFGDFGQELLPSDIYRYILKKKIADLCKVFLQDLDLHSPLMTIQRLVSKKTELSEKDQIIQQRYKTIFQETTLELIEYQLDEMVHSKEQKMQMNTVFGIRIPFLKKYCFMFVKIIRDSYEEDIKNLQSNVDEKTKGSMEYLNKLYGKLQQSFADQGIYTSLIKYFSEKQIMKVVNSKDLDPKEKSRLLREVQKDIFMDLISDSCNLILGDGRNYINKAQIERVLMFLIRKEAKSSLPLWGDREVVDDVGEDEIVKSFIYFVIFLIKKKDEIKMVLSIIAHCRDEDLKMAFENAPEEKYNSMSEMSQHLFICEGVLNFMIGFLKMYLPPMENYFYRERGKVSEFNKNLVQEKLLLRKIKKYYLEKKRRIVLAKGSNEGDYEKEETRIMGTFITGDNEKMEVLMDYLIFLLEIIQMDIKEKLQNDVKTVLFGFFQKLKSDRTKSIVNLFFSDADYYINEDDLVFDLQKNHIWEDKDNIGKNNLLKKRVREEKGRKISRQKWCYLLFRVLDKKFRIFLKKAKDHKTYIGKREYSVENCVKKNCNFLIQAVLYELQINGFQNKKFLSGGIEEVIKNHENFKENLNLVVSYIIEALGKPDHANLVDILNELFLMCQTGSIKEMERGRNRKQESDDENFFQTILIDRLTREDALIVNLIKETKVFKNLKKLAKTEIKIEKTIEIIYKSFNDLKAFEKMMIVAFLRLNMNKQKPELYPWIEQNSFKDLDKFFMVQSKNFELFSPLKTFFIQHLNAINDVFSYSNEKKRHIIPLRVLSNHNFEVYSEFPEHYRKLQKDMYSYIMEDEQVVKSVVEELVTADPTRQYLVLEFLINKIFLTHVKSQQHSEKMKESFESNIKMLIVKISSNHIKWMVRNIFLNFPDDPDLQVSCEMQIRVVQMRLLIVKMLSNIVTLRNRDNDMFNVFIRTIRNNNKSENFRFMFNYDEQCENNIAFLFGLSSSGATAFYKCSCGYIYGIGNCGQAWVEAVCPSCKQTIGGKSHKLTSRAGHEKINEDFISNKYKGPLMNYTIKYYHHELFADKKVAGDEKKSLMEGFLYRVMHLYTHLFYMAVMYFCKAEKGFKRVVKKFDQKKDKSLSKEEKIVKIKESFQEHINRDLVYLRRYLNLSETPYDYFCSLIYPIRQGHTEFKGDLQNSSFTKFMKFISSGPLQKLLKFEIYMSEQVKTILEYFSDTKDSLDKFKQETQKDESKIDSFKNDWILCKSTFNKVRSQGNNGFLVHNLRITHQFDFRDFTVELTERTGNQKYLFLKFYIQHKELVDGIVGEILSLHLDIATHFNEKYPFCFTKEHLRFIKVKHLLGEYTREDLMKDEEFKNFKDAAETLLAVKKQKKIKVDKKLEVLYDRFSGLWELILKLQDKFPDVFNFNFECHQGVEIGVNVDRLRKREINLMYFVVITNSEELNMMLTIFQTCAKFQNKIIHEFIAPEGSEVFIEDVPLAYARPIDFFSLEGNYLERLVSLYAFNDPSFNNASRVNFNFKRIEEILKAKLSLQCRKLLYTREHLESYPIKGETDETSRLLTDLQAVVKVSKVSEDSVAKIESFSVDTIRFIEDEIAKVLFYILRSGIRNPHMELGKFAGKYEVGLSQELLSLNLDLGMIHDLFRQVQLKLSFWKFNNQISTIYKQPLLPEERKDLLKFKESVPPVMLELLTKSLRLYINQKCTENNNSLLPLNLFEFMSYTEIGLIDIECWSTEEVTLSLLVNQEDEEDEELERPDPFTYTFIKIFTHHQIFEILQTLET